MANKRALRATRISVETDESTSIERQDQVIEKKINERGDVLVGRAEDRNVSAFKVGPFQRPSLGAWLNDRVDEFDVVYFARQDRAIRSMKDLHELAGWASKHGKGIVICEGPGADIPIDFSADADQQKQGVAMMLLTVISMASGLEVQAIKERVVSSHRYLREKGEWGGGVVPYGLMPERVPGEKRGWRLVHNPETMEILLEIVLRVIEGENLLPICKDLTQRGVPTPRDYWDVAKGREPKNRRWSVNSLKMILTSRTLLGEWIYDGLLNVDRNGDPIPRCDPMITRSEWDDLQGALVALSMPTKQRYSEPNPLLGVAHCARCGLAYYLKQETQKGQVYSNLSCRSRHGDQFTTCGQPTISLSYAVELTDSITLSLIGEMEVLQRKFVPGDDRSEEKKDLESRIRELEDEYYSSSRRLTRDRYTQLMARLEKQLTEIGPAPVQAARWEWEKTGQTYSQLWHSLAPAKKLKLLQDLGIKIYLGREGSPAAEEAYANQMEGGSSHRLAWVLSEEESNKMISHVVDKSRVRRNIKVWYLQEGDAPINEIVRSKG